MYNQILTTQLAIQGQASLLIANLTNIEHKPVVGDILYGSDAYYAQITRVGESVVEFTVIGELKTITGPQGPQGERGTQGPRGLTGPQGPEGEASTVPGPKGDQGPKGDKGDKGDVGETIKIYGDLYDENNPLPSFEDTLIGAYLFLDSEGKYDLYVKNTNATAWVVIDDWGGVPGPQGPIGPQGEQGQQGPQGPVGPQADLTIETWNTATKTLVLSDVNKLFKCSNTNVQALTIPTNASVAFPIGTMITFLLTSTYKVTFSGASGVTLTSIDSLVELATQYGMASLIKTDTNTWQLVGALE